MPTRPKGQQAANDAGEDQQQGRSAPADERAISLSSMVITNVAMTRNTLAPGGRRRTARSGPAADWHGAHSGRCNSMKVARPAARRTECSPASAHAAQDGSCTSAVTPTPRATPRMASPASDGGGAAFAGQLLREAACVRWPSRRGCNRMAAITTVIRNCNSRKPDAAHFGDEPLGQVAGVGRHLCRAGCPRRW